MNARLPICITFLITAFACCACNAQVYAGVTETGSILLSSAQNSVEQQLLIEPEPIADVLVDASPDKQNAKAADAKFASYVNEASARYRLPVELIHAVIAVESNYNPRAVSRKGAKGLMQLMPATAIRFGSIDVFDARQNILAGSHYLRWLLDTFGQNLELTLAAYNAGEAAVLQAGRRVPNFSETQNYVPKVITLFERLRKNT